MTLFSRRAAALGLVLILALNASAQVVPPAGAPPAVAPQPVSTTPPKPEVRPTGIAAKVNDQAIDEVAVYRALRQFPKEEHEIARKEILNHLVENTLIDQYLTALKITAEPAEVEKLVAELKAELQKANKDYAKELEAMMLTEAEFRSEVTAQMKWDKFLKSQGTDEALKKMFEAAPNMFDGSMVRARHILMTPGEDKAKQDKANQDLRAIKATVEAECGKALAALPPTATPAEKDAAKLKKAEELFGAYAKQYSTCPSKKDGGDLNFFPRVGAMVEPFAKAAFDMKIGDMSDVVVTEFGYHIVLVTAKNPGKQPTFEQAKEGVRAVYAMRLRDAVVGQMKARAKIEYSSPVSTVAPPK
ncbi:MAG: prsA1 [Frankiales bacterium]|nr:prsA1 [Frankiales bacterium]